MTLWIDEEVIDGWRPESKGPRQRGGQVRYSERAIECLLLLTEAGVDDAEAGQQLVEETPGPIKQVSADGAYDKRKFYDTCQAREVETISVPPRRNAVIWQHGSCSAPPLPRDDNLRRIRQVGRQRWKEDPGYHQVQR
jgi:hypothetical protein